MSKFRIYNIQLLPDDESIQEVGIAGYRKLFGCLRDLNAVHLKDGTQAIFHYGLPGDAYIGPTNDFKFPAGFVSGNFIRYVKTEQLTELSSGKTIFKAKGKTAVASKKAIPFVFDTKRHFLAIDGINLPKGKVFIEALMKFLEPVAAQEFPNHTLTINLVSRANALEDVFNTAVAYKTVDVDLAFPNGHETEKLLRELKETKTQLNIRASGGKKGRMSAVPEFLKDILRAAVVFGSATISYFVATEPGKSTTRKIFYNSDDTPVTFQMRHSPNDATEQAYFARVAEKLAELDVTDESHQDETE